MTNRNSLNVRKVPYVHSWRKFISNSSVTSVPFFWSKNSSIMRTEKFLWLIMTICSICCGLLIVRSNWLIYLNKGVKNQIIIENEQTINFPAITICNQMVAKRLIGCHWPSYNQFVRYYSLTSTIDGGEHWTSKLDKENEKYCPCPIGHVKPPLSETLPKLYKNHYYENILQFSPSVKDEFIYCQLGNQEKDCLDLFANRFTDIGLCASFNIITLERISNSRNAIDEYIDLKRASKNNNYTITQPGIKSGLKIVLRAGKSDYCGILRKWYGDGFHVSIQRWTNFLPFYFLSDFDLKLRPGYIYNIAIEATNKIQHTAHLGRCTNQMLEIDGMEESAVPFDRALCIVKCLLQMTYTKCDCIGRLFENTMNILNPHNTGISNINKSAPLCRTIHKLDVCEYEQIALWKTDEYKLNHCTYCAPTCKDTKYSATVTTTKLYKIPDVNKTLISDKMDDLIIANFYVASMTVMYIHEWQAFTFMDMLIYTGGTFALFFGISFLSLLEVMLEIMLWLHYGVRRINRDRRRHEEKVK